MLSNYLLDVSMKGAAIDAEWKWEFAAGHAHLHYKLES